MHTGHRQRMRERIAANGINSLNDHEVIEYLLYFVRPRIDVNETAHRLVNAFGNLNGVLDADPARLAKVEGVGEITAQYLTLLPELFQRYWVNIGNGEKQTVSIGKVLEIFQGLFLGAKVEKMAVILLDINHEIIDSKIIATGSRYDVFVHPREVQDSVIQSRAEFVILGHNHPNHNPNPSKEDRFLTLTLKNSLSGIGVGLLDHIIITPEGEYYSFLSDPVFARDVAF